MPTSHTMPIPVRLAGGTFLLGMAGLFGCIGYFTLRRTVSLRIRGKRTDGVIVGVEERFSSSRRRVYPRVEFETLEGQKLSFVASTTGNRPPVVGRKVSVFYLPDNPSIADIPSFGTWLGSFVFLFFAVGFLVMSAVFYLGLG